MTATAAETPAVTETKPPRKERSPGWVRVQGMLAKELRGRMRGPRAFVVLSVYLLFLTGFTLLIYFLTRLSAQNNPTQPVGKPVFLGLVAFELGLVCFLAPSFTAGVISCERERQSYDLLMTAPVPLPVVVGAKLFAALAYVLLLIVASLPLMSIALFLGGVAPEEIAIAFIMLLASALLFGTIGLCYSAWVRSTIAAATLAYTTMLVPVVAVPVVFGTVFSFLGLLFGGPNPNNNALKVAYYLGGFIVSLNPFIAGGLTEALLTSNRSLFFSTVPGPIPGITLYVVGPWLIYTVMALLGSAFFFALALYLARPARGGRRRRAA